MSYVPNRMTFWEALVVGAFGTAIILGVAAGMYGLAYLLRQCGCE